MGKAVSPQLKAEGTNPPMQDMSGRDLFSVSLQFHSKLTYHNHYCYCGLCCLSTQTKFNPLN